MEFREKTNETMKRFIGPYESLHDCHYLDSEGIFTDHLHWLIQPKLYCIVIVFFTACSASSW